MKAALGFSQHYQPQALWDTLKSNWISKQGIVM
jgi:hypothetical protein